jgi:hypothetical protein
MGYEYNTRCQVVGERGDVRAREAENDDGGGANLSKDRGCKGRGVEPRQADGGVDRVILEYRHEMASTAALEMGGPLKRSLFYKY